MKMSFVSKRFPFFSVPLCLCVGSYFAITSYPDGNITKKSGRRSRSARH